MPENPPLDQGQKDLLQAAGGYGSIQDIISQTKSGLAENAPKNYDPYQGVKHTPYPADALGYKQFYPKTAYSRLGFSPFANNFEKYKTQSTDWELALDAQKAHSAMHNNMFSFFGIGGTDSNSAESARQYEDLVALGTPIGRDDTYAWALKQYVQSGYTAAIVSSIVAEELALAGLTALSRGKTAGAAWTRTAKNFNRLAKLGDKVGDFNQVKRAMELGKAGKQAKNTADHMKDLQDISKARAFFNKTKAAGKSAARGLFPHAAGYVDAVKNGTHAMNGFANAAHGFSSFYRELREFNLAYDEAALEKAFVENDSMRKMMEAYSAKNGGKVAEGQDLKDMQEIAKKAGSSTKLNNIGLIYTTNKIGFGMLFSKFAPRVFKESITNSQYGKLFYKKANMASGKAASAEFVKNNFKDQFKYYTRKSTLKKTPLRSAKYLLGSSLMATTEGTQEYLQEVIQDAEGRRAVDKYNKAKTGSWLDYYGDSMKKFISPEGADIFLSGFAMGAFAGPHKHIVSGGANVVSNIAERATGNYKKNRQNKRDMQAKYEQQVNNVNEMFQKPWDKDIGLGGLMRSEDQDKKIFEQDQAVENNDEKNFRDVKDDATMDVIYNALSKGTFDTLIDQIEQMGQLTDEEITEAFKDALGDNPSKEDLIAFKNDAQQIVERAKSIKALKEDVDRRYINPFSYAAEGEPSDTDFGYNAHYMHNAFEYAKKQIVKNQYSYKRTVERQAVILDNLVPDAPFWNKKKTGIASDYTVMFNNSEMRQEISLLQKELEGLAEVPRGDLSPNDLKNKKEKTAKLEHLQGMETLLGTLRKAYQVDSLIGEERRKAEEAMEPQPGVGATITLKTKAGGSAKIVDERTKDGKTQYKVKKSTGWTGWLDADKVSLDKETVSLPEEEKLADAVTQELLKSFKGYMAFLAEKNDTTVNDSEVEKAFQKLLDFYALNQDGKNLTELLNLLQNPQGFEQTMLRKAAVEENIWKNKKEIIADSLEAAYKAKENNFLIQTLMTEHNAFLLEEDAVTLFEDEMMPSEFYDVESTKPIDAGSKRYKDIQEEIQIYLDKKWERKRAPREAYVVGDEVFTDDIIEAEEYGDEVRSLIKKGNKAIITKAGALDPEAGGVDAEILLNDKHYAVLLRPTVQPTVTKEEVAPTPTAKAAPASEATGPITSDTPFDEWPITLQAKATEAMSRHNEGIALNTNLSDIARKSLTYDSVEEFVQSQAGKIKIASMLEDFNKDSQIAEEVAETVDVPVDLKPETENVVEAETMVANEDILAEGEGVKLAPLTTYPEAEVPVGDATINSILAAKTTAITLPLDPEATNDIIRALRKEGLLKPNEKLENDKAGLTVKTIVLTDQAEKYEILFTYKGKLSRDKVDGVFDMIKKLGLPTEAIGEFTVPLELDGTTFYATSEDQKLWIEGQGKQYLFIVGARPAEEVLASGHEEALAWENSVTAQFEEAGINIDEALVKVTTQNLDRQMSGKAFMPTEEIQRIYEEAQEKFVENMKPSDFLPGEYYEMKGRLSTFGTAVVTRTYPSVNGVEFQSLTTQETKILEESQLSDNVNRKITDMDETIAEQSVETTEEQQEVNAENKAINGEITPQQIEEEFKKNQDKDVSDVEDNFFNNAKKDEDNCK